MIYQYEISSYHNNDMEPVLTACNTKEYFERMYDVNLDEVDTKTVESFYSSYYVQNVWSDIPLTHNVTFIFTTKMLED